ARRPAPAPGRDEAAREGAGDQPARPGPAQERGQRRTRDQADRRLAPAGRRLAPSGRAGHGREPGAAPFREHAAPSSEHAHRSRGGGSSLRVATATRPGGPRGGDGSTPGARPGRAAVPPPSGTGPPGPRRPAAPAARPAGRAQPSSGGRLKTSASLSQAPRANRSSARGP